MMACNNALLIASCSWAHPISRFRRLKAFAAAGTGFCRWLPSRTGPRDAERRLFFRRSKRLRWIWDVPLIQPQSVRTQDFCDAMTAP